MMKIAIIASTSGAVLRYSLEGTNLHQHIGLIISDRECGALDVGLQYGIKTLILPASNGKDFSYKLASYFDQSPELGLAISFYTRLFTNPFVEKMAGKLINFHPSILPACPGKDGFGDTVKSGSRFIGSTVHFIDNNVDTGLPILQACHPYNPNKTEDENRHVVFIQQCKQLRQIIIWYAEGRITAQGIINAKYEVSEFSPNLEAPEAITFSK